MLTLLLFVARAFISGGFQAAYVYTPEVGGVSGSSWAGREAQKWDPLWRVEAREGAKPLTVHRTAPLPTPTETGHSWL